MFDNIGEKIKTLAKVVCWVGIIASVVMGFIAIASSNDETVGFLSLVLIAGLGSLGSWVGSFVLYGFGELVSNSANVARKANYKQADEYEDDDEYDYEDECEDGVDDEESVEQISGADILNDLLKKGVITQNEYDLLMKKERKN